MEMEKWKYQQQEWQREFRMWQMENGEHNGDYYPPMDDHYDDKYPDMGHGMDMGMGGMFDWMGDIDMSWMDTIWEMMGNEDILCPMFGMIPFDPSWGVGSGADWEAGCRDNFRMQREYAELIMQADKMSSSDFGDKWCHLMGGDIMKQMAMFGGEMFNPFVEAAFPMCSCVTATIKDLVDGNMGMGMMSNVGQCVGHVQSFVGMFMEMDMGVKVDIELDLSPENIQMAIDRFNRELGDIDVMDENILTLLSYWDMKGEFKKMGVFTEDASAESIVSALAIVDIYNQAHEKDWTLEHYRHILKNAADWVEYYDKSRQIFSHIYRAKNPEASESDVEYHLMENFDKVYAAPTHISDFFEKHQFNLTDLAAKAQAAAKQTTEVVDFEQLMMDIVNGDHWDMAPYIALGEAYIEHLLDETEPQFPGFLWGLFSCLELEDIQMWMMPEDRESLKAAWEAGLMAKYMEPDFSMCMMPFNEMAIDWMSHNAMEDKPMKEN